MAISARLSRTIHRTLGDEAGEDLINWMGQVESNRSELRELMEAWSARTDGRFEAVDARFGTLIASTEARFGEQKHWMELQFADQGRRMDVGFATIEAKMERRYADLFKWAFAFWFAGLGAMAVLVRLMR